MNIAISVSFSAIRWQHGSERKGNTKKTKTQEQQCVVYDEMQIRTTMK